MKRFLALCLALNFFIVVPGCSKKEETKKQTTVSTPEGQTTTTEKVEVEKSGKNPPPANP